MIMVPFLISAVFVTSTSGETTSARQSPYEVTIGAATDPNTNQPYPLDVSVQPGDTASFPLEVANLGTQADSYNITAHWTNLPTSWKTQIDTNAVPGSGIHLLGDTIYIEQLGVGQSYEFTVIVDAPYESDGWLFLATLEAVSGNDPMNGTDTCDISVGCNISPGVTMDLLDSGNNPLQGPLTLTPGEERHLRINIVNTGNFIDTFTIELLEIGSAQMGWDVTFSNSLTDIQVKINTQELGGHEVNELILISIPEDAENGQRTSFQITTTSETDTSKSVMDTFDIEIRSTQIIKLETDVAEKTVDPGASAEFEVRAVNKGNIDVEYTPPTLLSLDEGWTGEVSPSSPVLLSPWESSIFNVVITTSESTVASESAIFEIKGSANDNVMIYPVSLTVMVTPITDFSAEILPTSQSVIPGETIYFTLSVSNQGNIVDYIKLAENMTPANWEIKMRDSSFKLDPKSDDNTTIEVTIPKGEKLGEYNVILNLIRLLDSTLEVITQIDVKVVVIDYPDLTPVDLEISDFEPNIGDTVTITATISNLGLIDAEEITVRFLKGAEGGSQFPIGEVVVDIPSLGEEQVSVDWEITDRTDRSIKLLQVEVDPENEITELSEENNDLTYYGVLVFPKEDDSSSENGGSSYWGLGSGGGLVVITFLTTSLVILFIVGLNSEAGRFAFLKLLVVPLYSKLSRDNALANETREQIYDYVQTHPGDHFRSIMSNLKLTNGTVAHHLTTLEKLEYIKSERDGSLRRFYPKGQNFTESIIEINGLQGRIMEIITDNPGISQKEVAAVLEISAPTLNYHIKALRGARLIHLKRAGKRSMCYVDTET